MSKKEGPVVVVGQIVGHKSLKIAGGLRVEFDFFDARPKDICCMTLLSVEKAVVKIQITPHEEKTKKKTKGFGRSKTAGSKKRVKR